MKNISGFEKFNEEISFFKSQVEKKIIEIKNYINNNPRLLFSDEYKIDVSKKDDSIYIKVEKDGELLKDFTFGCDVSTPNLISTILKEIKKIENSDDEIYQKLVSELPEATINKHNEDDRTWYQILTDRTFSLSVFDDGLMILHSVSRGQDNVNSRIKVGSVESAIKYINNIKNKELEARRSKNRQYDEEYNERKRN